MSVLFFLLFPIIFGQECLISTSIANWLKNNTGPCTIVKGNFILDKKADNRVDQLYEVFTNLTRIEGCLSVKGFTGRKNLHFLSKLQEVICNKTIASADQLTNVIHVEGPNLNKMGLNSLVTVDGPGEIVLLFEDPNSPSWMDTRIKCFARQEIIFLAYHPQFKQKMYQACETNDPCLRPDLFNTQMKFGEIPANCTVYFGSIYIYGLYVADNEAISKFKSIKLIIGDLKITGTLFDNLTSVFPNLEMVYPAIPLTIFSDPSCYLTMNCSFAQTIDLSLQNVGVGLNRFLVDISLPRLMSTRPIDVTVPIPDNDYMWSLSMGEIGIDFGAYLPDTIQDHCSFFPQFKRGDCGTFSSFTGRYTSTTNVDIQSFIFETWLLAIIATSIGLILSTRAIILLQFSSASKCLPFSKNFIMLVILITALVALESCVVYQKSFQAEDQAYERDMSINMHSHFSEFHSIHLTSPLFQHLILILAWSKHACLALIILSYFDIIIYYQFLSRRFSKYFCLLAGFFAIGLCVYLQSQLGITIRGRTPHYYFDQEVIFMPFVTTADYLETFASFVPLTRLLPYKMGLLNFAVDMKRYEKEDVKFNEISFEIHGNVLTEYTVICDILMTIIFLLFHVLRQFRLLDCYDYYNFLLFLVISGLQMIRFFINDTILRDYCKRFGSMCFVPGWSTGDNEEWMSKTSWDTVEKIVEKLPYLSYPVVSFYCYNFARYQHYLVAALNYRMEQNSKKPMDSDHVSDIPNISAQ